jgi:hypothetical protein
MGDEYGLGLDFETRQKVSTTDLKKEMNPSTSKQQNPAKGSGEISTTHLQEKDPNREEQDPEFDSANALIRTMMRIPGEDTEQTKSLIPTNSNGETAADKNSQTAQIPISDRPQVDQSLAMSVSLAYKSYHNAGKLLAKIMKETELKKSKKLGQAVLAHASEIIKVSAWHAKMFFDSILRRAEYWHGRSITKEFNLLKAKSEFQPEWLADSNFIKTFGNHQGPFQVPNHKIMASTQNPGPKAPKIFIRNCSQGSCFPGKAIIGFESKCRSIKKTLNHCESQKSKTINVQNDIKNL